MNYKMNVKIKDPKTPEGMTSELFFELTCSFVYDEEQYGNGHYLSIEGKSFSPQHFDLRYDKSFRRNEKEKWLENWARNYWSGENGSWVIESLEIVRIAEQERRQKMKVHITYLDVYAKQLSQLVNELLHAQNEYDVTADLEQVEKLSGVLEELKTVVDNLPLA